MNTFKEVMYLIIFLMIAICTLCEGNYFLGAASLINSCEKSGYKGIIYVGFRGDVPVFFEKYLSNNVKSRGATCNEVDIVLCELETDYHFTNYKPDFMLSLLNEFSDKLSGIVYFDPDITLETSWSSIVDWLNCGVALCEDVNSPLPVNHPRRVAWRDYFRQYNFDLSFKEAVYVNGGFVGLMRKDLSFLETWKQLQETMALTIDGLARSSLKGKSLTESQVGVFKPFSKTDQDALNATIEAWAGACSVVGKEAMGFTSGSSMLPHALGVPKPWDWLPLVQTLKGMPPRVVDRAYWKHANGIIRSQSTFLVKWRQLCIKVSLLIGRFYRRGGL